MKMDQQKQFFVLFKKRDIPIYLILLGIFLVFLFFLSGVNSGSKIIVTIDGKQHYRFTTDDVGRKSIEYDGKHLMDLVIETSDVYIEHSECPLHLCERDHLENAGVLVCIPQKVLITFEDEEVVQGEKVVDLVTR